MLRPVMYVEELFERDLADATALVCADLLPDICAALDEVVPLALSGDRAAVRRYLGYVHDAADALTRLPAIDDSRLPSSEIVVAFLRNEALEIPWVAPSTDGQGVLAVLVDRVRGFAAGLPQECVWAGHIGRESFPLFAKLVSDGMLEREHSSPLRRAMALMDLSANDVAELMHVSRQAVDNWLFRGPPADRYAKIAVLAEVADILHHRLKEGLVPAVVRRPADAYDGRSMLELIADDEHRELLDDVQRSFDYTQVA